MARNPEHTLARLTVVAVVAVALLLIGSTPIREAPGVTSKVNGCATNINLINSQIELYHANTRSWPADLTVVTDNTSYFPDGPPICPLTGLAYPDTLVNNRIDTSGHNPHPWPGSDSSQKSQHSGPPRQW